MELLERIRRHAIADGGRPMVQVTRASQPPESFSRATILSASATIADDLARRASGRRLRVGLVAGNTPEWVAADLALLNAGHIEIPVPLAFSAEQARHLLHGVDSVLADPPGMRRITEWLAVGNGVDGLRNIIALDVRRTQSTGEPPGPSDPEQTIKVIHTSGTTGTPKGVRIGAGALDTLVSSLDSVMPVDAYRRYLSMVPLSLLIEQVVAIYLTLGRGGCLCLLPQGQGLLGEAQGSPQDMLGWIARVAPTALTLPPSLVEALARKCDAITGLSSESRNELLFGSDAPPFLACGGAPVDANTLAKLMHAGICIYEGYGLSENSSVVCLNTCEHHRVGSVGRPLPRTGEARCRRRAPGAKSLVVSGLRRLRSERVQRGRRRLAAYGRPCDDRLRRLRFRAGTQEARRDHRARSQRFCRSGRSSLQDCARAAIGGRLRRWARWTSRCFCP